MVARSPEPQPISSEALARRRLVTVACLLAQFMAAVEATIVSTAMPTIVGDLGGFQLFSWVFAAYLLAQAVTTPIYGRLSDLYGRKLIFFAGAGLFIVSSAACGFAWGMVPLIVFRTFQGLGAGAVQPIAWIIIGDIYSPAERARMQGWLSSVFGTSAIAGPMLGGFIVQHLSWALVFWINVPIGIATIVMLYLFLDEKLEARPRRIDYLGSALLMVGVGALLTVVVQIGTMSGGTMALLSAIGAAALTAFAFHEARVPEPIVPFRLWRQRVIATGNFGSLVIGALMMCNAAYLPTYVQGAMGGSPTIAGLVLGATSVAWTIGTMIAGRLMIRTSYLTTAVIGGVISLVGSGLLLAVTPAWGPGPTAAAAAILGFGMGFINTTFVVAVQTVVGWSERGTVTAATMFMRTIGQSIGSGIFGAILGSGVASRVAGGGDAINQLLDPDLRSRLDPGLIARLSDAIATAMHHCYLVSAGLAVLLMVFALRLPPRLSPTRLTGEAEPRSRTAAADD